MTSHRGASSLVIIGRRAVLEALASANVEVGRVMVSKTAPGEFRRRLAEACSTRDVELRSLSPRAVEDMSRDPRHDQGVCAEVTLRLVCEIDQFTDSLSGSRAQAPTRVLALDNVTNRQNIGMAIRSARASGIDAMLWPLMGSPWIEGLIVKSSASTVFDLQIVRSPTLSEGLYALKGAGFTLIGLDAGSETSLFEIEPTHRVAVLIGGETAGLSPAARELLDLAVRIPMAGGVESLNVAAAATLACFHIAHAGPPGGTL